MPLQTSGNNTDKFVTERERKRKREKFEVSILPWVPGVIPDGMPTKA